MAPTSVDWKAVRTQLSARRKELFDRFLKNPSNMHLAREIRLLDDRMAECNERLERERKREECRATSTRKQAARDVPKANTACKRV
jgi:hypothetical protein